MFKFTLAVILLVGAVGKKLFKLKVSHEGHHHELPESKEDHLHHNCVHDEFAKTVEIVSFE